MTGRRSNQNVAALVVLAMMALYVGSYGVVRFKSASGRTPLGSEEIILGIWDIREFFNARSPKKEEIKNRWRRLRLFYAPLRWVDHQLTGATI